MSPGRSGYGGGAKSFHLGAIAQRVWGSSSGVQGEAPVGGLEDESPEAEAVCRHCLHILTA